MTLRATSVGRSIASSPILARLSSDPALRNCALSVVDQAIVSAAAFGTSVLVGRCGSAELGAYYLVLTIAIFVRGIQDQLVLAPYMVYHNRKQGLDAEQYAGSSLIHQLLCLAAISGALWIALAIGLGRGRLELILWLFLGIGPLLWMRDYARQMSLARLDPLGALKIDGMVAACQLGLLGLLGWTGWLSVETAYLVMAATCGVATLHWLCSKRYRLTVNWQRIANDFRHNWLFSRWSLADHLLVSGATLVIPWVVAASHGEAETGLFGGCAAIVGLANMFMMGLANYFGPRAAQAFASGGVLHLRKTLQQSLLLQTLSIGGIAVAGFVCGGWLAVVCYGREFAGVGLIIGVMSLTILVNSWRITAGNGLWAMELPGAGLLANSISILVTILSLMLLAPPLGSLGAALAGLCGTMVNAAVLWLTLWRVMRGADQPAALPTKIGGAP